MSFFGPEADPYSRQPLHWKFQKRKAENRARRKRENWQHFFDTMTPRRNYVRHNDPQYDTKAELGLPPECYPGVLSYEQITALHQRAYRAQMNLSPLSSEAEQSDCPESPPSKPRKPERHLLTAAERERRRLSLPAPPDTGSKPAQRATKTAQKVTSDCRTFDLLHSDEAVEQTESVAAGPLRQKKEKRKAVSEPPGASQAAGGGPSSAAPPREGGDRAARGGGGASAGRADCGAGSQGDEGGDAAMQAGDVEEGDLPSTSEDEDDEEEDVDYTDPQEYGEEWQQSRMGLYWASQYGSYPYTIPGSYPYTMPGSYPYTMPGSYPYTMPGSYPYTMPGSYPYTMPGSDPYTMPGSDPYTMPGSDPYTMPGSSPGQFGQYLHFDPSGGGFRGHPDGMANWAQAGQQAFGQGGGHGASHQSEQLQSQEGVLEGAGGAASSSFSASAGQGDAPAAPSPSGSLAGGPGGKTETATQPEEEAVSVSAPEEDAGAASASQ